MNIPELFTSIGGRFISEPELISAKLKTIKAFIFDWDGVFNNGQKSAEGICLQLALSQAELGGYLGLSRANVSRQLGQLKEANVIMIDGTQIVITDDECLTAIADAASSKD